MSGGPTITIVTACYNSAPFLGRLHRSLKTQFYKNFEWICVDDCSTDDTVERLLALDAPGDLGMKVYRLPTNSNWSAPTALAIDQSRGDAVVLVDHDDELLPGALEHIRANWSAVEQDPRLSGLIFPTSSADGTNIGETLPVGIQITMAERLNLYPNVADTTQAMRGNLLREIATFDLLEPLSLSGVMYMDVTKGRPLLVPDSGPIRVYHRDNPHSQTNLERISRKSVITYAMLIDRADRSYVRNGWFWIRHCTTLLRYSKAVFGRWFECLRWVQRPLITCLVVFCWPLALLAWISRQRPIVVENRPFDARQLEGLPNLKVDSEKAVQ